MDNNLIVCVMAKPPVAGQVKTRLAPVLGDEGAADLARAFLEDTLALCGDLARSRCVLSSTDPTSPALPAAPDGGAVWDQGAGDLGHRMERTLRRGLELAPAAMVIGTDSPGLPAERLAEARAALDEHDAVLGPCADGGFYLLGLRRCPGDLLAALPWSQADTRARTVERLQERGLTVVELEPWFDVDRPDDLLRLMKLHLAGDLRPGAVSRLLDRVGGHLAAHLALNPF